MSASELENQDAEDMHARQDGDDAELLAMIGIARNLLFPGNPAFQHADAIARVLLTDEAIDTAEIAVQRQMNQLR